MTAVELPSTVVAVAAQEAKRRGIAIADVVEEAVRRYVAAPALGALLDELDADDAARSHRLSDDEAMAIALAEQRGRRAESDAPPA
jgi:hypothetical protein